MTRYYKPLAEWRRAKVEAIIEAEFRLGEVTAKETASRVGLSRTHFTACFKATYNRSFAQTVMLRRYRETVHLITTTNDKLASIATDCGFSDQNHMGKIFRSYSGTTPKQFRQQHRRPAQCSL